MIPVKINPPQDDEPHDIMRTEKKDPSQTRTTAPMADDGRKKRFREVLEPDDDKKSRPTKTPTAKNDDEEEKISPLELAAEVNVRKLKPEPSITSTRVFHQDESTEDASEKPSVAIVEKKEEVRTATPQAPVSKNKGEKDTSSSFDNNMAFAPAPQVMQASQAPEAIKMPEQVTSARETLLALAKEMVEQIQKVIEPGKTETTLTLKHPPLFSGVEIKITEFDTSQKQFNLTFSNILNPEARALIELSSNQARLQEALIAKGYTLQMITVEQKIPGLQSTRSNDFNELAFGQDKYSNQKQAGTATDDDQGDVT